MEKARNFVCCNWCCCPQAAITNKIFFRIIFFCIVVNIIITNFLEILQYFNIEIFHFLKVLYITCPYVTLYNADKTVIMNSYPVISGLCFLDAMWGGVLNYKLALANYIHKLYRRIKYWNFIYQNWSTTKGTNTTNTAEKFSLANTGAASIRCISVC